MKKKLLTPFMSVVKRPLLKKAGALTLSSYPPEKPSPKDEDDNPYQDLKAAHNAYAKMLERYKVLGKQTGAARQAWVD